MNALVRPPAKLALLSLYALAAWWTTSSITLFIKEFPVRDFGSFYQGAWDYWHTGFLYAPRPFINLNAPHMSVLLFSPLLVLDVRSAAAAWFLIAVGLIRVSLSIIRAELRLSADRLWWVVAVLLASSAMQHNWRQGQIGAVLLLTSTLAWRAARHEQPLSSWWIALAASLKPWIAIWVVTQNRGAAIKTIAIGIAGVLLGIVIFGASNWLAWASAISTHAVWPYPSNLSLFAMLVRATGQTAVSTDPAWPIPLVWMAFSGIVIALTWQVRHGSIDRAWLLWSLVGLLISPIAWSYYLLVLTGPIIAWGESQRWPRQALIALAIFVVPSGLVDVLWEYSVLAGSLYTFGALLLWVSVAANRPEFEVAG